MEGKKSKSFEEREQEYERTRARIFNQQDVGDLSAALENAMTILMIQVNLDMTDHCTTDFRI